MTALPFLPDEWTVDEVHVVRAGEDDLDNVTRIFAELQTLISLLGPDDDPAGLGRSAVRNDHLPPGGSADHARSYCLNVDQDCVGILEIYHGYPSPTCLYIGSLFLRPIAQRHKIGMRVVRDLERRAQEIGWAEIRLAVGLRNWPAFHFWTQVGYHRISRVSGDAEYGEDKFASIELLKELL